MADAALQIGNRLVGPGCPAYIVAELSGNHNGSLERALATIRACAAAGADAIKLQTYRPDTMTIESDSPDFVVPGSGPWSGRTLFDLYEEAHTPWEWHERLFAEARACGIEVFSTPFDDTAVELLERLGAPAYKIASFEMIDDALVRTIARTGKPVIVSTGMANLEEITHCASVLRGAGSSQFIFLKCTSSYPAPDDAMNLRSLPLLSAAVGAPAGLSDHSMGTTASIVAVAFGAVLIEKHVTLSRADGGVDSHFSLEPAEFAALVRDVRRAEAMRGEPILGPGVGEEGSIVFRRSLYVVERIEAGDCFTERNVRSIRPGHGLSPRYREEILGKRATRAIARGTPLTWELVERG